jgi:uncharacterized protein (DUF2236 family)
MVFFVREEHIIRKIWSKADTIMLIFAGSAAEFALNKAVDWLYFTGKLPADPIGRLFTTVEYARQIIFAEREQALAAIARIRSIHSAVESARGEKIPDWAYRDVLFMLIHYSISAYEALERKLTPNEKQDVYETFRDVGEHMLIPALPENYTEWLPVYEQHQAEHLQNGRLTKDLFKQYRKHLGSLRYRILLESQILVVPHQVARLMHFNRKSLLKILLPFYRFLRKVNLAWKLKQLLVPTQYYPRIRQLEM